MPATIEVQDFALKEKLAKFVEKISPEKREQINRKVGIALLGIVQRNFAKETGEGQPWARLKPATKKWKKKRGYAGILKNTGALRNSFLSDATPDQARVYGRSLVGKNEWGEDTRPTDLARIHQFGAPSRGIPARPMLPSTKQAQVVVNKIYNMAFVAAKQQAGFK